MRESISLLVLGFTLTPEINLRQPKVSFVSPALGDDIDTRLQQSHDVGPIQACNALRFLDEEDQLLKSQFRRVSMNRGY